MKNNTLSIQLLLIIFLLTPFRKVHAQFVVTPSTNYAKLVDSFMASGVTVSNIKYSGNAPACGYFSGGNLTNLGCRNGMILSTGKVVDIANGYTFTANSSFGTPGDSLLNLLSGAKTIDAAVLEFDVLPAGDTIAFSYIFGSEDYPEFVGGNPLYHDYLGAFISGTNPAGGNYSNQNFALVPNTSLPVTITSINDTTNSQYFVKNNSGTIAFDGFTKLLQIKIPVQPASTYHLKIAIADGGDQIYDSGIFLKNRSLLSYSKNTGVSTRLSQDVFQFYPNPASDKITFKTEGKGILTIRNQLGEYVSELNITESETELPTRQLTSGVYFLTFRTATHLITKKFIVQQ